MVDYIFILVFGKALNYPVELGHSLKLQCSISEDMGIQKNFRWADEGQFKKLDEPNKTKSTYEILLTEEYLGNRSVICYYGEYFHSFDAGFFRTVFQCKFNVYAIPLAKGIHILYMSTTMFFSVSTYFVFITPPKLLKGF